MDIETHELIEIAFSIYNVSPADAFTKRRGIPTDISNARQLAFKLLIDYTDINYKEIGAIFNMSPNYAYRPIKKLNALIDSNFLSLKYQPTVVKYMDAKSQINFHMKYRNYAQK